MRETHDNETGASYYYINDDAQVHRTVSVTDVVVVDLDESGGIVGVEIAVPLADVTRVEWRELYRAYPTLENMVPSIEDERVSLAPAGFEDALRAMLGVSAAGPALSISIANGRIDDRGARARAGVAIDAGALGRDLALS